MSLVRTAQELNSEQLESDLRNRIQDTVRSYRHFWDPLSEMLQNSVDAINRRYCVENIQSHYLYEKWHNMYEINIEHDYRGKILIELWAEEKRIRISDNGAGIEAAKIEKIILPDGSDKVKGKEYGYKGKGLTYTAFISSKFYLKTKFFAASESYEIAYDGLFDWLISPEAINSFPGGPIPDARIASNQINDLYNTILDIQLSDDYSIKFPSVNSLDNALELLKHYKIMENGSKKYEGLEVLLRTKTAIGNTKYLFNEEPVVPIDIVLKVYEGRTVQETEVPYRYFHPKESIAFVNRAYSFLDYLNECQRVGFDKSFRCLYWVFKNETIGSRLPLIANIHHSAISSNRLNDINEELGFSSIGLSAAAITYGVHLSIDGMPTGIRIDNWDQRGSANKRFLAVADVELNISDELDSGRKGISSTRAEQISDLVHDLKLRKQDLSNGNKSDTFASYASKYLDWGQTTDFDLEETDFEQRAKEAFRSIIAHREFDSDSFDKILKYSSLMHIPTNEEEVRALFHELVARSIIKGYNTLYAAASRATYDAGFVYRLPLINENFYVQDPLGFSATHGHDLNKKGIQVLEQGTIKRMLQLNHEALCVEFKYSLGGFIDEINKPSSTSKQPRDLNLLIVWTDEIDIKYQDSYTLTEISGDRRVLHSSTHKLGIITPESTEVYCIVLKKILSVLD